MGAQLSHVIGRRLHRHNTEESEEGTMPRRLSERHKRRERKRIHRYVRNANPMAEEDNTLDIEYLSEFVYSEPKDPLNGFILNNYFINEDLMTTILSFVPPKNILKLSFVCKNWNKIIKSQHLWIEIYTRTYKVKKMKLYPWYLYYVLLANKFFNTNLIRNGNGQNQYEHWKIMRNGGDGFTIEDPPVGCEPLPLEVEEFQGYTSCFATSYGACEKQQTIHLTGAQQQIMDSFKPVIYASEWVNGRFDCGSSFILSCECKFTDKDIPYQEFLTKHNIVQFQNEGWVKKEMSIIDYEDDIQSIVFSHQGQDTSFWKGHYGSKMAGAVLKIMLE